MLTLSSAVDVRGCEHVWELAISTEWADEPVWFHGDVAAGNLLVRGGRLCAVIDFGTCGVGDPACDLVIAWTWLTRADRTVFRDAVQLPDEVWQRARGWALWKALITIAGSPAGAERAEAARVLEEVLSDPVC